MDALNKRFLLLLSATPVQNDLTELYNLLTLLKPGIFKTLKEFRAAYMTPGQAAPAGQSRAPARADARRHGPQHARRRRAEAAAPPRRDDPGGRRGGRARRPTASSPAARRCAGWRPTGAHRLALQHLLGAAGSSPAAAAGALCGASPRATPTIQAGTRWRERWAAIGTGGKEAALIDLLRRNPEEKKLVFVHYRETLDHLADLLARRRLRFRALRGQPQRPRQGRRHRRVPRASAGAAVHRIRRRRAATSSSATR